MGRKLIAAALVAAIGAAAVSAWLLADHAELADLMRADPDTILADADLAKVATKRGRWLFAKECAGCHGSEGEGNRTGVPSLRDAEHLYEAKVSDIEWIILHGIRSGDPKGWHLASMPAYGTAHPNADGTIKPLSPREISDLAEFLLARGRSTVDGPAVQRGKAIYADRGGCWDCHGENGLGDTAIGAPNLVDDVWLYGDGSKQAVIASIERGRAGVSPAFARRLAPVDARALAVLVASMSRARPAG